MHSADEVSEFSGGSLPGLYPVVISEKPLRYQYQPFQNNDSVRMLTLEPGKPNTPLTGKLEFVNIDSAGLYEAVSYVWADPGPPNCRYEIIIRHGDDERLLELRGGSIFAALHRIRLPDRKSRVWADQICINQDDLEERSQQVQFMNKIYKNAGHVLVWLGLDENKEAGSAFGLIHKLGEELNEAASSKSQLITKLEHLVEENKESLYPLTNRTWFKRGWIVQEIGTKAPATIFWGDAEIEWDILSGVCERLTAYHILRSKHSIDTSVIKFLFERFIKPEENSYHANRFNFLYELHRARGLNFTNDRDRVFAFLGHYSLRSAHFPNRELASIKADYTKTVEQVYINLAKRALKGSRGDSALIALAGVQHPNNSLPSRHEMENGALFQANNLPSWVPDWRTYQGFILSEPINPHRAHGDSAPKLEIVEDSVTLRIHGLEVDTIEACSRPLVHKEFHRTKGPGDLETTIEYLWHSICREDSFNLNDKYLDGQSAFFAFMQTLSNGCVQIAGREGKPYHEIPDSRWLEQAAMYLVRTLSESDTISPELQLLAKKGEREHEREEWSRSANGASKGRAFARTSKGYYVLGPAIMEKGDTVCVLFGGKLPFCLRPLGDRYLLVGECYVHGLVKGEALDMMAQNELSEKIFELF